MSMYKKVANFLEENYFTEAYGIFYYTPKLKKESLVSAYYKLERAKKELEYVIKLSSKRYKGTYKIFRIKYFLNIYNNVKYEEIDYKTKRHTLVDFIETYNEIKQEKE